MDNSQQRPAASQENRADTAALPRIGFSIEQAAEILGVSRPTLFRELKDGRGPASFVIRGRRLFTLQALQEYAVAQQGERKFNPGAVSVTPVAMPG